MSFQSCASLISSLSFLCSIMETHFSADQSGVRDTRSSAMSRMLVKLEDELDAVVDAIPEETDSTKDERLEWIYRFRKVQVSFCRLFMNMMLKRCDMC